jgi:hypothetical protein
MVLLFPISFCDLYYGYNDNTCVNEPAGKLSINLKDYLLISGWLSMSIITIITIGLYFMDFKPYGNNGDIYTCLLCGCTFLSFVISSFVLIWDIIGAVIFWELMDDSKCSKDVYNYVFISLVIKLILCGIGILQKKNENKK